MDNRLESYAKTVVIGIFKDFRHLWSRPREWERDLSRLLSQLESRGISLITLDLPSCEKHLNRCLAEGMFTSSGLVLTRTKRGEKIPIFLREIFLHIFAPDGVMVGHPCADAVLLLKTLYGFFKKIEIPCAQRYIDEEISNFIATDARLPDPILKWDLDDVGIVEGERLNVSLQRFAVQADLMGPGSARAELDLLDYTQRCFDIVASSLGLAPSLRWGDPDLRCRPKHGPGAVSNLSKENSKYRFPFWPDKLQHRFPRDGFALPGFGQGFSSFGGDNYSKVERPSKLIAVPKTIRKPRLIASEPVEYQWAQQYVAATFVHEFNRIFTKNSIKLHDQKYNQEGATQASICGTSATVDLSEASDRLSLALVECFFRANNGWLLDLHSVRSRLIDTGDQILRLKKFAPQGNACTFPVQSIVFFTLAVASVMFHQKLKPSIKNIDRTSRLVRVYGDDIIIHNGGMDHLRRLFSLVGLKVNESKTFSVGNFRESCGVDAFMGYDVTPPRVRGIPSGLASVPSLVETSNNFYKRGLWYSSDAIRQFFKKWDHLIPIRKEPDVPICLISHVGSHNGKIRMKYNKDLQVHTGRVLVVKQRLVEGRMEPRERLMQYFTEKPDPTSNWKSGFARSRTTTCCPGWAIVR